VTVPTATVTFAIGATTVTLPAPLPGYKSEYERAQSIGQTAAGADFVYDKDYGTYQAELVFEITAAQKSTLDTFFASTAVGGVNAFTYTDHYGTAHASCRFLDPKLVCAKLASARYRVSMRIRTAALLD